MVAVVLFGTGPADIQAMKEMAKAGAAKIVAVAAAAAVSTRAAIVAGVAAVAAAAAFVKAFAVAGGPAANAAADVFFAAVDPACPYGRCPTLTKYGVNPGKVCGAKLKRGFQFCGKHAIKVERVKLEPLP